jgi:hypothetical protein
MAYKSSKDAARVYVDWLDVHSDLDTVNIKTSAVLREFKPLGATWPTQVDTGARKGELTMSGLYNGSFTATALSTLGGANKVVSALVEGEALNDRFYGWQAATVSDTEVGLAPDDVHTQSATFSVNGEVNYGYVVHPPQERTTGGNSDTTYADLGAAAAGGGHGFLHVSSITLGGSTSCTVKVRHSTDHVTFVDHTSFTNVTASGSECKALAALNRYLSVSWAWNGAGAGQSIFMFVGVAVD